MEAIGIIFFACLAFAIAILILITCCFFKVNGGKDSRDVGRDRSDTNSRLNQMAYNKARNENQLSNHSHNVILFLNKKDKYSSESKQNLTRNDRNRSYDDADEINSGYQTDDSQLNNHIQPIETTNCHSSNGVSSAQTHGCYGNDTSNHVQFESTGHNHGLSSHNHGSSHDKGGFQNHDISSQSSHGFGHCNGGFSSNFSGSHSDWGHHSGDNGHFGGHDGDGDGGGDD